MGRGLPLGERHDRQRVVRRAVNGIFNCAEDTMRRNSGEGALADAIHDTVKRRTCHAREPDLPMRSLLHNMFCTRSFTLLYQ